MQFPKGTTFAVADGQRLRLFSNIGDGAHLQIRELPAPSLQPNDKGTDKGHHSSAANPDGHQQDEDSFAAATAELLNRGVLAGDIQGLYIIAPPRTLGVLRRHYHAALRLKLLGEMDKEHTHDNSDALQKVLLAA